MLGNNSKPKEFTGERNLNANRQTNNNDDSRLKRTEISTPINPFQESAIKRS